MCVCVWYLLFGTSDTYTCSMAGGSNESASRVRTLAYTRVGAMQVMQVLVTYMWQYVSLFFLVTSNMLALALTLMLM